MGSVPDAVRQITDSRSRQERIYTLWQLVAIVILAAMTERPRCEGCECGGRPTQRWWWSNCGGGGSLG